MAKRAKDRRLILHIGLHKTATSYLQNVLSARRYDLLREGVLYPSTGTIDNAGAATRDGAQSGHALFTRPGDRRALVADLLKEMPEAASTVLVSSEDFTLPRRTVSPADYLARFGDFGTVEIVLVLRRQDVWIESWYKQLVDQYGNFETRSLDEFLKDEGPGLLDFHRRFAPWRELVGPENFHVISYDDLGGGAGGAAIGRRLLEIAGVSGPLLEEIAATPVPGYESVRAIDTIGLRVLNGYHLADRAARIAAARSIYEVAPAGEIELMTAEMRAGVQEYCAPINERIEAEWFTEPVPGLRFGRAVEPPAQAAPSGPEMVAYLDQVIALCESARAHSENDGGSAA